MDYKLATQLQNTGYNHYSEASDRVKTDGFQHPNLEELIEACGNSLQALINDFSMSGDWIAFTNRKDERGDRMEIRGKTPSECVAKLWLKLNKK